MEIQSGLFVLYGILCVDLQSELFLFLILFIYLFMEGGILEEGMMNQTLVIYMDDGVRAIGIHWFYELSESRFEKITLRRPKEFSNFSSRVHAIVFEVDGRETIGGSAYGGQRAVCCSPDLAKLGVCKGEIIHRYCDSFEADESEATLPARSIHITKTGIQVSRMSLWRVKQYGKTLQVTYLVEWLLAFVILGIFWFTQYARFWREIIPLQNCITLVITLGMFEMALWYFDYAEFNETGVRPIGITVWTVTVGTIKRIVSRLIILMVSMGYGVVRSKVFMLGATFFLASEVLELVENVGAISDLSGKTRLILVLPVALLDAFFIIWIFNSLSATLNKLQGRRMMAKLDIYRKFMNALVVAVVVSVGWIFYELYFKSNDVYNENWQNAWIIPAFWQVLSFSLLGVICILWAPSQNSTRYAYSGDEDFDRDETSLTLINPAPMPSNGLRSYSDMKLQGSNGMSDGDPEEEKTA